VIKRRLPLMLAIGFAAGALGLLAQGSNSLAWLEGQSIDARFQLRGADFDAADARIVLVKIDDGTFNYLRDHRLSAQWPFPRRYHARVIDALRRAGARVVAVDIQFTEPSNRRDDNALIGAVGRAGGVVLSTTAVGPQGSTAVLGGDAVLRRLDAQAGNTSLIPDGDGTIRSTQHSIHGLPTFAVAVAGADANQPVSTSLFGGTTQPVPIDYAGPPGTFPAVPYWRLLSNRFPARLFAGRIAIVGASASTFQDLHETPTSGTPMPGPEVLANETATVLAGIPLRGAPTSTTVVLILALALLVPLLGIRAGTIAVVFAGLGALLAWAVATQIAFESGVELDFSDPAAALLLATAGTAIAGLWAERVERRRLRTLFAANSAGVVAGVLDPVGRRPLEPTAIIAGYRIEEAVGRGGMGVVYRATQAALGRTVALKLIATEHARDPVFRARFEQESRLAAAIEHPHVIPVYEAGEDDGLLFIAMRLVDGPDLAAVLAAEGALDPGRAARLIAQLAAALDAAHAHGLVHRDVKPANALLTLDRPEHLYLTDFGVAKAIGAGPAVTAVGGWVGTLDYLAPEQIGGEEVGPAVDVYALAGMLHHCLTGEVPFPRSDDAARLWAHLNAPPPAPSSLRPGIPVEVDAVVARGMAKGPAERYETATALADALLAALAMGEAELPMPRPAGRRAGPEGGAEPTVASD